MRVRLHLQVRDYMDPTSDLATTLCCVDEAHSLEGRNECTDPTLAHAEGLRCMHKLHTDPSCAAPTALNISCPSSVVTRTWAVTGSGL